MPYLGCSVRLYVQLYVGGRMPYLGCSVCLYLQLYVGGRMSYLGCSVRLYLQLYVGGRMSYLRSLCLFTYSGVQHIVCCVFVLFSSSGVPRVSLNCPFLIVPSVFSNVYLWFIRL